MASETITRGDRAVWVRTFTTAGGTPYDLTGCTVWFTAKRNVSDVDADAAIAHYWTEAAESGLSRTDPDTGAVSPIAAGVLFDVVTPSASAALTSLSYHYDVQFRDADDNITTLAAGLLFVDRDSDITQRTTTP